MWAWASGIAFDLFVSMLVLTGFLMIDFLGFTIEDWMRSENVCKPLNEGDLG